MVSSAGVQVYEPLLSMFAAIALMYWLRTVSLSMSPLTNDSGACIKGVAGAITENQRHSASSCWSPG